MKRRKKKMKKPDVMKSKEIDLRLQIKKITDGLFYTSETDAEILPFTGKKAQAVTSEEILAQTENEANSPVEEKDFTEFFSRLTEIQDWFGDEEKTAAKKFTDLKDLLEKKLKDLKVFKVGKIQLDIYAVGLDAECNLMGIQTKAVET